VRLARVTLDVGLATFQPVRAGRLEDHTMLEESYEVTAEAAAEINATKKERRPVVAVGTTVVRALESAVQASYKGPTSSRDFHSSPPFLKGGRGELSMKTYVSPPFLKGGEGGLSKPFPQKAYQVKPGPGTTSLFIHPGYEFKVVDRLLTNFHLPRSTLLMLVSAFAGRDLILHAYREAVREKYRFFSYGDCMIIL